MNRLLRAGANKLAMALSQYKWIVLSTILAFTFASAWWSSRLPSVYEWSTVLSIAPNSFAEANESERLHIENQLLTGLREYVLNNSELEKERIESYVKFEIQPRALIDEVHLRISYRDRSAEQAELFVSKLRTLATDLETGPNRELSGATIKVLSDHQQTVIGPKRSFITSLGLFTGIVFGLGLALAVDFAKKMAAGVNSNGR
jgi:uncharacterized protein involved in exopolysaccharide biosynthesis